MSSNEQAFFFDACRRGDAGDVAKVCELFPELINAPDAKGYTALIIAAYSNHPQVVQVLLDNGAEINAADVSGNTALMGASFRGYPEVVKILLYRGAEVNQQNGQGAPAITFAATFGQLGIAELLLQHGASPLIPDSRGKTAIDHARMQENEAMEKLLKNIEQRNRE